MDDMLNNIKILLKIKIQLPCNAAILLQGSFSNSLEKESQRGTCTPVFASMLVTIVKRQKVEAIKYSSKDR